MSTNRYRKIQAGDPDKVNGKSVAYDRGDCLSLKIGDMYLAAFITAKFNKYYDLTLLSYYRVTPPAIDDFINGRCFARLGGDEEPDMVFLHRMMLECFIADANDHIQQIGTIALKPDLECRTYEYVSGLNQILERYHYENAVRERNTANFEQRPDIHFIGDRLVPVKRIIITQS